MKCFILLVFFFQSICAASNKDIKSLCYIKPCEIKGDFDGDKKIDSAILVQNKIGEKGIQIKFANKKTSLLGAGIVIGNGGSNFDWMDHWELHQGKIDPGPTEKEKQKSPKSDSLYLAKTNSASGIVYWTGSEFNWIQQGD